MKRLALYGAGRRANTEIIIAEKLAGTKPAFIIDQDPEKQGEIILGLPVLSLQEAINQYADDFDVYVTVALNYKLEIFNELLANGIEQSRIVNFQKLENRLICSELQNSSLVLYDRGATFCCKRNFGGTHMPPMITWEGEGRAEWERIVEEWDKQRHILIDAINNDESDFCRNCDNVRNGVFPPPKTTIGALNFSFGAPCQLKCVYCSEDRRKKQKSRMSYSSINELFCVLRERNLITKQTVIYTASGEITIHPEKDKIFDTIQGQPLCVTSNALIFDERLAGMLENGSLIVSIDAGTKETYRNIKGVDAFEKVWSNIYKYLEHGVKVIAKYIFLPDKSNHNDEDVFGFVNDVAQAGVNEIICACDVYKREEWGTEDLEYVYKMIDLAKRHNIHIRASTEFKKTELELLASRIS